MKLKSLAAAALAVAAASSAHAYINISTNGKTELVLAVQNSNGSFLLDTGLTINALKDPSFASQVWDVTGLSAYASFSGNGGTGARWALAAFDGVGTTFPTYQLISTAATGVTPVKMNNSTFTGNTFNVVTNPFYDSAALGTHPTLDNGSSYSQKGAQGYVEDSFFNLSSGDAVNQIGNAVGSTAVSLISRQGVPGNARLLTVVKPLDGYNATFNGTTLTIANVNAVPEPGTYAMLAAGLAAVGFVVRRRRAA